MRCPKCLKCGFPKKWKKYVEEFGMCYTCFHGRLPWGNNRGLSY